MQLTRVQEPSAELKAQRCTGAMGLVAGWLAVVSIQEQCGTSVSLKWLSKLGSRSVRPTKFQVHAMEHNIIK